MHFYFSAPIWEQPNQCPNTCPTARPTATEKVSNARVIKVTGAQYRSATFDGVFLLEQNEAALPNSGLHKVKVYCLWFSHRLKTRAITLKIDGSQTEFIGNYSGEVVSNLSK